jgi:membrane associated rhomboid family serine protease
MADFSGTLTPAVKTLLFLILGIYFADLLLADHVVSNFGKFSLMSSVFQKRIWEFVTFPFIHVNVGHVLGNAVGLFFFGPMVERWLGTKKFLAYYFTCSAGAAALFSVLVFFGSLPNLMLTTPFIGASASIYGILVAAAIHAPFRQVSLVFPPVTMTMRQLALGLLAIAIIVTLAGIPKGGSSHVAHLAGALVGFLLLRAVPGFDRQPQLKIARRPKRTYEPKIRPKTAIDLSTESEVDAILDKISREGFQSLTDQERELLQRASKKEKNKP